jgi:glutamyl-tRNA reductase
VTFILHIVMIGLNFKTAPVEIREVIAVPPADMTAALDRLQARGLAEAVLLSTCNRTEAYVVAADTAEAIAALTDFIADMGGASGPDVIRPHLYREVDMDAVAHLFRVASGLDSMVIGETQILGQVREAYRASQTAAVTGKVLHQVFEQAIAVGKRVQTETRIGQNAVSVSYAAVELAKKVFRSLSGRRAMAIGAGETAKLTVRHLQASGVKDIIIANRTLQRAEELAQQIDGRAITIEQIPDHLAMVDVVISSTGAPGYVITQQHLAEAIRSRRGRPIFLFDIAVPRDIDPKAAALEGAFLYDIDDLQAVVAANLQERALEAEGASQIVTEELEKFRSWVASIDVVPTIRLLRDKVETLRHQELTRLLNRLPDLTDRERAAIEAMTVTLMNKILNEPTQQLKGMAGAGGAEQAIDTVSKLFGLAKPGEPAMKEGG